ncbi:MULTISPECIES: MarR family winged helix-turn-helix transcriptional regulator [Roseobacteraceae]|uniref:MarR family winged helix-turn-helix transcriptional regulator n=1 Tax=Roseobacteraceae TaxID=2854170 RepID=UPI001C46A049|nr:MULTISPECIES: MarR family transcriptional regulator [Roseobacteraceae]MBV7409042.1 MarR family transcriptional regulator [Maritimibacter sp. DP1N21-5]MBY5934271.1 MarR family transcriptional regulator [Tateyamaria omphalii]
MRDNDPSVFFEVFNEIGIIEQLSRAILEARLPHGLIAPHFSVLNHLTRVGDGRTPMEMARAFQVPKTSMTHTLKGLEQHGLVEMRPNPDDGRSKRVWLTERGREVRAETIAALGPDFAKLAQGFDVAQLVEMRPVLTALREYLDAARD